MDQGLWARFVRDRFKQNVKDAQDDRSTTNEIIHTLMPDSPCEWIGIALMVAAILFCQWLQCCMMIRIIQGLSQAKRTGERRQRLWDVWTARAMGTFNLRSLNQRLATNEDMEKRPTERRALIDEARRIQSQRGEMPEQTRGGVRMQQDTSDRRSSPRTQRPKKRPHPPPTEGEAPSSPEGDDDENAPEEEDEGESMPFEDGVPLPAPIYIGTTSEEENPESPPKTPPPEDEPPSD